MTRRVALLLTALLAGRTAAAPPKPLCSTVIVAAGYPCEDHYPVTEDGFVLGVARIPPKAPGAPAVILQHGLLDSAATYINNLPSESLGFILHDAGYDVWLGNSRGNTFSQNNNKIPKHDKSYWELVDWDLMARYDDTAFVDYVLNVTHKPSLTWVGHSQGTTQMFGALAMDYGGMNSKVNLFVALAPVAHVFHQDAPFFRALVKLDVAQILQLLGENQFLPNTAILRDLGVACDFIQFGCEEVLVAILGGNPKNMNGSRMSWYLNWEPADTSVHNIIHWTQMVRQDTFQMFDWGSASANQLKYNQTTPPAYDLTSIRAPVALFSGGKDTLADPTDVALLRSKLGNRVVYDNFQTNYGHLDFVWGLDCHVLIYPQVVTLLQQYAK